MILQSLTKYYEILAAQGRISRYGWSIANVSYAIVLRPDGSVKEIRNLKYEYTSGKKTAWRARRIQVPSPVVRTAGIKSNFMCDTGTYLLGYGTDDPKNAERFEAAKKLHLSLLENCESQAAKTICNFFSAWSPDNINTIDIPQQYLDEISKANLIFSNEYEQYLHEDGDISSLWDKYYSDDNESVNDICLVTGEKCSISIIHNKIKGVDGAQSAGANLINFNASAYESYGKDGAQGLNAPVGRYAMYAYTTALNHLLSKYESKAKLGDTTVVWWSADASDASSQVFGGALYGNDDAKILDKIMINITQGLPLEFENVDIHSEFYILGISPNSARLSVRFFYHNEFGKILGNVIEHYKRLEITKSEKLMKYLTPYFLALETVSPQSKDKSASPQLAGALLSAIINNWRYPELLYDAVLTRVRAEHDVNSGKAAIIKACLLKNNNELYREVLTVALNENSENQAYVLGRLFSALEQAQYTANGSSNIKERYLTSACATPCLVFPGMLMMASHHTAKTENGKYDDMRISKLIDKLEGGVKFPSRLSNEEQGLFLLGYYHQTQKNFDDRQANIDKKAENNKSGEIK